jgi:ectoine hydroxylase-related dioxygenase (phytanoyl-CoA dioxygenase family)
MKTTLTREQIQKYQDEGFLSYPDLLSPAEVTELKTAVIEAAASMGKKKITGPEIDGFVEEDTYNSKIFTQRLNLWRISERVKSYMLNPALGKMLCDLEGVDGLRVWHDQALIKEPFGNATSWHLDNPYWSFHSRKAISIWIALEDATPYNGCMCFIPGSHKLATYENSGIGQNMSDLFKIYPKMAEIDPVPVPMKAGDCSFHNGLVAHGAGANMTRGRRIAMTSGYMPEGSTFNGQKNILPNEYFKSLKVGDVLENDEQNPVVYSARVPALA